jgi:predicted nucleic acid-binding protein
MSVLLLDTNVVSILFKPDHALYERCSGLVGGNQLFISFMSKAELLLWPAQNRWGPQRRQELLKHVDLCTTLFPDDETCARWVSIISESRSAGQAITTADAWIAATARQWDLPLVTVDYRDFDHLEQLILVPVVL